MSTIGARLKTLRGKQSLEIFSNTLGIHRVTLSRFEKDERVPDADFLKAIIERMGICSEWLIMGTGPMFKNECSVKTADMSAVLEEKKIQYTENIDKKTKQTADVSTVLDAEECRRGSSYAVLKPLSRQRFCELKNSQHTENTDSELQKTSDVIEVLAVQLELNTAYKATAALQRELTDSIRENADLRVELERRKAQVRDLERENADLRKAMKPAHLPGMDGQGVA